MSNTKYIVALQVGGIQEQPNITYIKGQVIMSPTPKEAEDTYNENNQCDYYYGCVIGHIKNHEIVYTEHFKQSILHKLITEETKK